MAEIPDNIRSALSDYIRKLSREIEVKSAILFGSYATGAWNDESDIDIAIFSDDFSSMGRVEAINFLLKKALPYKLDIQPLAYDGHDLVNEHDNPFIHEILTTGIKVA
jgi:predicted nucleotidyltransferase